MSITLDELRNEVDLAISQVSLHLKKIHEIGRNVTKAAAKCDAASEDVMVVLMTYIAAVKDIENGCQTDPS